MISSSRFQMAQYLQRVSSPVPAASSLSDPDYCHGKVSLAQVS